MNTNVFLISRAISSGNNSYNKEYPVKCDISSVEDLLEAVKYDHIPGSFKDATRGTENFLYTNCIVMDCDNDNDDSSTWVDINVIEEKFKNIKLAVISSRSHMKDKKNKSARPRFHVYFPLSKNIESASEVSNLKHDIAEYFPNFDKAALDASRFIYGNENAEVLYNALETGTFCIDQIKLNYEKKVYNIPVVNKVQENNFKPLPSYAVKKLLDYIDPDQYETWVTVGMGLFNSGYDYSIYNDWSAKSSKYNYKECKNKWNSFKNGENRSDKISIGTVIYYAKQNGYIEDTEDIEKYMYKPKAEYSFAATDILFPEYLNDIEEYMCFRSYLKNKYVSDINGNYYKLIPNSALWSTEEYYAVELYNEFYCYVKAQLQKLDETEEFTEKMKSEYKRFFNGMLNASKMNTLISKSLKNILISSNNGKMDYIQRDENGYQYQAPIACGNMIYDIETGKNRKIKEEDYCTYSINMAPTDDGKELFLEFLDKLSCGRRDWEKYLQLWCGGMLLGSKNMNPKLLIAYSKHGRAGKSTFWNLIQRILESKYSCNLPADILAKNFAGNKKNFYAQLEGKYLAVCPEFPRNTKLDDAALKILSSRDPISVERKFENPRDIETSHSCVLYTNHLPKLDDIVDGGVRRRMVIMPFDNYFEPGKNADDNISEKLYKESSGYILKWMLEGAREYLLKQDNNEDPLKAPECILKAGQVYEDENNPLFEFFKSKDFSISIDKSDRLLYNYIYEEYLNYCADEGKKTKFTKTGLKKKILELYGSNNNVYEKRISGATYLYGLVEGKNKEVQTDKAELILEKQKSDEENSKYKFMYENLVKENNDLKEKLENLSKGCTSQEVKFIYNDNMLLAEGTEEMKHYESTDSKEYKADFADSQKVLAELNKTNKYQMELENPYKVKEHTEAESPDEAADISYEEFKCNSALALRRNTMTEIKDSISNVLKNMKDDADIMKKSKADKFVYLDNAVRNNLSWYSQDNHKVEKQYLDEVLDQYKAKLGV